MVRLNRVKCIHRRSLEPVRGLDPRQVIPDRSKFHSSNISSLPLDQVPWQQLLRELTQR